MELLNGNNFLIKYLGIIFVCWFFVTFFYGLFQQYHASRYFLGIFGLAFGVAGNLSILKYSRKHETEADKIGLVFMALAGYDPTESIAFWERMSKLSVGLKPPQILSTHPSDATRIADLQAWLPEAMKYYKKK